MVTLECVDKLIRKDMVDPVNGEKLTDRDIIVLQRVRGVVARLGRGELLSPQLTFLAGDGGALGVPGSPHLPPSSTLVLSPFPRAALASLAPE